jgi:hypothetical protein
MPTTKKPVFKRYKLDANKVKRIQRILKAKTEQEALEQLVQTIIDNDIVDRAHRRLVNSGIDIVDTMGRLPK